MYKVTKYTWIFIPCYFCIIKKRLSLLRYYFYVTIAYRLHKTLIQILIVSVFVPKKTKIGVCVNAYLYIYL